MNNPLLLFFASFVWLPTLVVAWQTDGAINSVAVNLAVDIPLVVFLASFIEHSHRLETQRSHRGRQRALALAVQGYYQVVRNIAEVMLHDAVASENFKAFPSIDEVKALAASKHGATDINKDFWGQPAPYAAYIMCFYTGHSPANVHPPRTSAKYANQLARSLNELYQNALHLDAGILPNGTIDAMTSLKRCPAIVFLRDVDSPIKWGYWAERDIDTIFNGLGELSAFFAPILGLSARPSNSILIEIVSNAAERHKINI